MKNSSNNISGCSTTINNKMTNKMTIDEAVQFCLKQARNHKGENNPYIDICELLLESKYKTNYSWQYLQPSIAPIHPDWNPSRWNHRHYYDDSYLYCSNDLYCSNENNKVPCGTDSDGTKYGYVSGNNVASSTKNEMGCTRGEEC